MKKYAVYQDGEFLKYVECSREEFQAVMDILELLNTGSVFDYEEVAE